MTRLGILIDLRTCIGCHACSVACKVEFDVPLGVFRDTVKYVETGTYPQAKRFFIPLLCNHCEDAPCLKAYPTGAIVRLPNGEVVINEGRGAVAVGDLSLAGGATRALFELVPAALAVVSLALAVYPAVLLARTWSSPLARTPAAGVLFLSTALLMGTAVAMMLAWTGRWRDDMALRERLRHVLLFLVVAQIPLLGFWLLSVDTNQASLATALSQLLHGAGAAVFWSVVIGLGLVLPACLLPSFPRRRDIAICGALAVLVGASSTRYLFFSLS